MAIEESIKEVNKFEKQFDDEVTRREFFSEGSRFLAGAGAAVAFSSIDIPKVFSTEVKSGMSWKVGLHGLVKDVFESAIETSALFIDKNDESGRFILPKDGKTRHVDFVRMDDLSVDTRQELQDGTIKRVVEPHNTHTLAAAVADYSKSLNMTSEKAEEMKRGLCPLISMPPSYRDIYISSKNNLDKKRDFIAFLEEHKIAFVGMVADPRGMWSWEYKDYPEYEHEKEEDAKITDQWFKMATNRVESLSDNDINFFLRLALQRLDKSTDEIERTVSRGYKDRDKVPEILSWLRFPIKQQEIVEKMFKGAEEHLPLYHKGVAVYEKYFSLDIERNQDSFAEKSMRGDLAPSDYDALANVYKYEGALLTFSPYQQLGLSYNNLHK